MRRHNNMANVSNERDELNNCTLVVTRGSIDKYRLNIAYGELIYQKNHGEMNISAITGARGMKAHF